MKKLLIGLVLFVSVAYAKDSEWVVAKMKNEAGGEIVLTNRRATDHCSATSWEVYSTTSKGEYQLGCWAVIDDYVMVLWQDGTSRLYPLDSLQYSDWFMKLAVKKNGKSV